MRRTHLPDALPRSPRPATDDDLEVVIALIIGQQSMGDRNVPSLGVGRVSVIAELSDLDPPWTETLRVVCDDDDDVVGAVLVDWDIEARRSWIHGPWIAVADDRWTEIGAHLVDAATSQLPTAISRSVMTAVVDHHPMVELAGRLGWPASEVNHVMTVDADTVEAWPTPTRPVGLRLMSDEDVATVRPLHDAEFPDTYYSAAELAARVGRDEQIVLIADGERGSIDGYIAGQIQPDGDGYIDFLAVAPSTRRTGVGRMLVTTLCRQLIAMSTTGRVCLTVQTGRSPARRLYESLGFDTEVSIVGFERPATRVRRTVDLIGPRGSESTSRTSREGRPT